MTKSNGTEDLIMAAIRIVETTTIPDSDTNGTSILYKEAVMFIENEASILRQL